MDRDLLQEYRDTWAGLIGWAMLIVLTLLAIVFLATVETTESDAEAASFMIIYGLLLWFEGVFTPSVWQRFQKARANLGEVTIVARDAVPEL